MLSTRLRIALTLALLLLAPLVGEWLLGNIPVSQLAAIFYLVPLYGVGALLVREAARHLGGGWPTIFVFAAAYALVEEGPVDQMVFNPGYLGLDSFAGLGPMPGLGISGSLVVFSLALHTVWSICVPIALVESFDPDPTRPWWGRRGLVVIALLFAAGCVFLGYQQSVELDFVGTPAQFVVSAVAILALVAVGVLLARRPHAPQAPSGRSAPRPVLVGLAAFTLTSAFWLLSGVGGAVGGAMVLTVATAVGWLVVRRWARADGWDARHRLALAAGAAATYATWFGPSQAVELGTAPGEIVVGAAVVGLLVAAVVVAAALSIRHRAPVPPDVQLGALG